MRVCLDCRKAWLYRLPRAEKIALQPRNRKGRKLHEFYPPWVFHEGPTKYCDRHTAMRNATAAKRRAAELHATPEWADREAIKEIYRQAAQMTRETGVRMHVDHIVPLRGRTVSGLHVESNLQILPARENIRKSNRFTG